MLSLFVTLASVRAETLGPCYLYDRYCLETIWKPTADGGSDNAFGIDFTTNNWQESPEKHYKGCFYVDKCKASGIALVCKTSAQQKYEKTYVSASLPTDDSPTDYNTFYAYLTPLDSKKNDICVTLEADVGEEQALDKHTKRGSDFKAKFITGVKNITASTGCQKASSGSSAGLAGAIVAAMLMYYTY
eukprot:GEMP01097948.1.p1 GENE.GEMP01097948.1~~GEMP01097948.1.p1  ORF type:complete len:188 (+),score=21.71 GEMP01097948.1:72-635(+)